MLPPGFDPLPKLGGELAFGWLPEGTDASSLSLKPMLVVRPRGPEGACGGAAPASTAPNGGEPPPPLAAEETLLLCRRRAELEFGALVL